MDNVNAFPERGINDLFAELWSVYLARVVRLLIISVVSAAIVFGASLGVESLVPLENQAEIDAILAAVPEGELPTEEQQQRITQLQLDDLPVTLLQSALLIGVAMVVSAVAAGAYLFVIGAHYVVGRVLISEALAFAFQRVGSLIVATLIALGVVLAVWVVLFVVPFLIALEAGDAAVVAALFGLLSFTGLIGAIIITVYVAIRWFFAWPVVAFEGLRGVAALRRSWELTQGFWWRTFGIFLVVVLALFAISFPGLIAGAAGLETVDMWYSNLIAPTLAGPVQVIAVFLLYADLRTRKENPPGYGPDQIARELGFQPLNRDDAP